MGAYGEVRFESRDELEKHEDEILDKLDEFGCTITYCPDDLKVELVRNGGYNIDVDEINAAMEKYGGKVVVTG
ncbi:uncharacterized protein ACHE_30772A [Aspergillus chevalieri]|uniref:Uncharacterized protein n=1 Tax=Aspergillus chevalieri TaxID=182096 RepID=A0A7R7VLC1_ASPCH|nr:uncharacterized protein ACHE_30772A [Aspergillus chevalieri]BCR86785.1 hypothetical protein ACHE_30772A [Aspergillus chevalieri]